MLSFISINEFIKKLSLRQKGLVHRNRCATGFMAIYLAVKFFYIANKKEVRMEKKSVKQFAVAVSAGKPKKLSKAGEWLRANQGKNLGRIIDWRAVMK